MSRFSIAVAAWIISLAGCSGGKQATYPVHGKVTFADGKPLVGGSIGFRAAGDAKGAPPVSARGDIQSDGTFTVSTFVPNDGAVVGEHAVIVVGALPPGRINALHPAKPTVDEKYKRFESSGLKVTVKPSGPNEFDLTVTPPGH